MRRSCLLIAAALVLAACQPTGETPPSAEAETDATTQTPLMPADAPPQEDVVIPPEADPESCNLDQGADAAARLVARCIAVSPATHPPCNAANPCRMIQDEIDRACGQYGPDETRPAECAA